MANRSPAPAGYSLGPFTRADQLTSYYDPPARPNLYDHLHLRQHHQRGEEDRSLRFPAISGCKAFFGGFFYGEIAFSRSFGTKIHLGNLTIDIQNGTFFPFKHGYVGYLC